MNLFTCWNSVLGRSPGMLWAWWVDFYHRKTPGNTVLTVTYRYSLKYNYKAATISLLSVTIRVGHMDHGPLTYPNRNTAAKKLLLL